MAPSSLTAAAAARRLLDGHALHLELRDGTRQWWFEAPHAIVDDATITRLLDGRHVAVRLVEAGDSLFGLPRNSQTWSAEEGRDA